MTQCGQDLGERGFEGAGPGKQAEEITSASSPSMSQAPTFCDAGRDNLCYNFCT